MSHRLSQNARHTRDLLEELERDKELDVLREYLTRFELFPRQRDPAAAPIRFEELKELAKHWKLHRQRNFWKTNTTKEDLVKTLYRHINTKIIPQETRDENNGNGSPSHMMNSPAGVVASPSPPIRHSSVAIIESPRNRSVIGGLRPTPPPSRGPRVDSVFGDYGGDLFGQRGNYEDGMIYLSRFRKPTLMNNMGSASGSLNSVGGSDSTFSRHSKGKDDDEEEEEQVPSADALDYGVGLTREIHLKQECAFSIYHFSTIHGHERQMVVEGCMLALSKLAVFEDTEVKRFCAASILNLLCEPPLGSKMADEGVLLALLELAKAQHEEVRRHTSMALCRFSYERSGQLRLVQEGCVSAILSMLNVPDLETKEACVKALINIASASSTSVAESVVHILMKLATRKDQSSAKFAAEAICNLSLLGGSRAKVVEEGILDTVCELAQQASVAAATGSGEEAEDGGDVGSTRKHLAIALCNLSGLSGNLEPLSHGRILECLEELLKCEKPREVREMCAVTIANISSYPPSLKNLALSDAVANLVELGTHHTNASVRENTALCLSNMSATADSRALLARFGVVSLLLRFVEEEDTSESGGSALAQQYAVLTLCSMLAHPAYCAKILQSNLPAALARLAMRTPHDRVRELCANALFNVSCEKSLHAVLLQDDTIRSIVRLCRRKGEADDESASGTSGPTPSTPASASGPPTVLLRYQECALGCLLNLSFAAESRPALLRADVVATLAKVFNKPPVRVDELLRQCAGVLANLSFDAEARARMVADNGVRLLRRIMSAATSSAAAASDVPVSASAIGIIREILRSCATACCNLAADALEKTPVLDMLIDLSASSYAPTILTCAIAFAKLASSATHRVLLTRCTELYPALTLMMRCGVEDIQIYSAVALCNLAVEPPEAKPVGVRHVWKEGTVPDFIVNALLRINSDSTKEICARALFNLLTHDELRAVHIKDGVLYALVKLARLESVEIRTLCVTALYNLSCDPALAETLMELKVAQVITKLCEMEFSSQEIHRKLAACLTNLASEPKPPSGKKVVTTTDSAAGGTSSMAVRLVESGALVALLVLCEHADPSTRHACAAALCFLSAYRVNCEAMATLGLVDVLTKKLLLAPLDAETSESESDSPSMELELRQQHEFALNALCNISCFPALHDRVEEAGAVPQIIRVLAVNASRERNEDSEDQEDETMMLACAQTLGNLTFHARHRRALLTHGLIPTLLTRPQALRCSQRVGDVCAEIVATLCEDALHWNELIATGAVQVLREITEVVENTETPSPPSQAALRASIYALSQLARCEKYGEAVIADGALDVVARALDLGNEAPPPGEDPASKKAHEARQETAERCAVILRALSTQGEPVCLMLMRDVRLVPMMQSIVSTCCPGRRQVQACKHVILAFYNITSCRISVEEDETTTSEGGEGQFTKLNESEAMRGLDAMVISGVVSLLIRLSTDGGSDTAPACAVALAHIKHRIKERLALAQAQEAEGSEQALHLRQFEEMDNLMEAGVVTALLAMFELDPAGIQRVDRLAAAMPPALPVLRAATEKDWTFLKGNSTLHFETPLPVCWDFWSSAIDDARFIPAEPRTFLAVLAPVVPPSGATIQDKIYGRFRILQVRPTKCLLRLENSRFARLASALLNAGQSGSAGSSASDLSDAIALAIGDGPGDNDDSDCERDRPRHSSSARKSNVGSSAKSIAGSSSTDDDDAASETRTPSPVKKKPTGRSLMMSRSPSHRGSAAFGLGSSSNSTGNNTDSNNSLLRRATKAPSSNAVVRRPSRSMIHDNMHNHSTSSMVSSSARHLSNVRKDSHHRLGSDSSSSSSGVTLPKI